MTLGKKIIGGYSLILALLLVVAVVAFFSLRAVERRYAGFLDEETRSLIAAQALGEEASNQIGYYRGLLVYPAEHEYFLGELRGSHERFDALLADIRNLSAGEELGRLLDQIDQTHRSLEQGQEEGIRLAEQGQRDAAVELGTRMVPLSTAMREAAVEFIELQESALEQQRAGVARQVKRTFLQLGTLSALAILLGLGFGIMLTRSITSQLRDTIAQLSTSSAEILATTSQVAAGAAETATAVSQTTATVEEVKQTAQLSSQKARYVSESAQKVSQVSLAGRRGVEGSIRDMHQIQTQMESIAESIVRLSDQSQSIGDIIATVTDLAEQSNLLAVNAAIEAARAGEHGRGFAVVAQEVKSLADQSRQATAQIRSILGDIQKATSAAVLATEQGHKAVQTGVGQSAETGESIRQLGESITEAANAATQIAASSQQQMVGMDQVAMAMENIKQASLQNVAGTRQAESAAQNLHELGQRLSQMIETRSQ